MCALLPLHVFNSLIQYTVLGGSLSATPKVSLIPRPLPDSIYVAAMEKNQEKAWDQNYVTDQKW